MPVKINPEDLGYIAGVIDSDGYVGLGRQKENRRRGSITENYKPMVVVTQAQPEAVDFIRIFFGGSNGISKHKIIIISLYIDGDFTGIKQYRTF